MTIALPVTAAVYRCPRCASLLTVTHDLSAIQKTAPEDWKRLFEARFRTGRGPLASGVWGGVYVPGAARPTVVAVGPAGSAYTRDDGATWVSIDSSNYWSVGFASPRAGWAVGTRGRITRLSGF